MANATEGTPSRMKGEAGYSLVEVVVSILLLSIAIIPMVGMFDAGLRAASTSGNYDKARMLANATLEDAKAMSFSEAENLSSCPRDEPDFTCSVTKKYVYLHTTGAATAEFREDSSDPKDMLEVTVTVEWGDDNSYSTTGLVAK